MSTATATLTSTAAMSTAQWIRDTLLRAATRGRSEDSVVWFVVAIWVLLALGATIILGAIAWCFIHADSSLYAVFRANPWEFRVGCN